MLGIAETAEKIGFKTTGAKVEAKQLRELVLPCILHWDQNHFVVLYKIKSNKYTVADPAKGIITYSLEELIQHWSSQQTSKGNFGVVLLLEPTPALYQEEDEWSTKVSFVLFFGYLFRYKKLLLQLALGFAVGSLLQLILPFLTQSVVDVGINTNNLDFIYIVLIAQFMLLVGRMSVDFIRSWILLHISTRLNVSVLSLFLSKLMRLPISFFDTKQVGGIMQRMGDQKRIESFLTGQSLRWRSLCLIW